MCLQLYQNVSAALPKDPIYLLSLILSQCQSEDLLQIEDECIHKVPKLTVAIMKAYRSAAESSQRHYYSNLLSHALEVISYVIHRLTSTDIWEVLTTLDGLLTTGDSTLDEAPREFKPALASFLASLSAVEIHDNYQLIILYFFFPSKTYDREKLRSQFTAQACHIHMP